MESNNSNIIRHAVVAPAWDRHGMPDEPNLDSPQIKAIIGDRKNVELIYSKKRHVKAYVFTDEKMAEAFDDYIFAQGSNSRLRTSTTLDETLDELRDFDRSIRNGKIMRPIKAIANFAFFTSLAASFALPFVYGAIKGATNPNAPMMSEELDNQLFYASRIAPTVMALGLGVRAELMLQTGTAGGTYWEALKKGHGIVFGPIFGAIGYGTALGLYQAGHFLGSLLR